MRKQKILTFKVVFWQQCRNLLKEVSNLVKSFLDIEQFSLIEQVICSVSLVSAILLKDTIIPLLRKYQIL